MFRQRMSFELSTVDKACAALARPFTQAASQVRRSSMKIVVKKLGSRWQPVDSAGNVVRGAVYNADGSGYSTRQGAAEAAQMLRDISGWGIRSHATIPETGDPGVLRSLLGAVARKAAASVFASNKSPPSETVVEKAKSAALGAIQRHPAVAYAKGVLDIAGIASNAVEEARQRWELVKETVKKPKNGNANATKTRRAPLPESSQEMKDLREEKAALLRALDYAGIEPEQRREYHRRVDEIGARMRELPR